MQLEIETRDEPVTIESITATATGFPFVRKAAFDAGVPELNQILDVGWRTARLCAHETYMDCPYYEQLQYAGDTRVQCLVSLFQTGDARLMRNAIDLLNDSRQSDGCTMSRYPTRLEQYIPGFALWWIGMVHDYHWYVDDAPFVRRMLPGVRSVLSFFEAYQKENGSLASLPVVALLRLGPGMAERRRAPGRRWRRRALRSAVAHGLPLGGRAGEGAGLPELAQVYSERERVLRATIRTFIGTPAASYSPIRRRSRSSRSTPIPWPCWPTSFPATRRAPSCSRTLTAPGLAQGALYFKFYMHQALAKVGEGDRYLDQLDDWRGMLATGSPPSPKSWTVPGVRPAPTATPGAPVRISS